MNEPKRRGRPPGTFTGVTPRRAVRLDDETWGLLERYGAGNASRGIRWLVDKYRRQIEAAIERLENPTENS